MDQLEIITDVQEIAATKLRKTRGGGGLHRTKRLLINEMVPERYITIHPKDYGRLAIDPRYQRSEIKGWHNDLRDALKRGTKPPRIAVATRDWAENGEDVSAKWWVVDGQQRMWAHVDLNLPIEAALYRSGSLEDEKTLFAVLNHQVRVGPNHAVYAHPGITSRFLVEVNEDQGHPLYQLVMFQDGGSPRKVGAGLLVTTIATAFLGYFGSVQDNLINVDRILEKNGVKAVREFLASLGNSFKEKPTSEMLRAFAKVVRSIGRPLTKMETSRIRRLKLSSVVGATFADRVVLIQRRIYRTLKITTAEVEEE